MKTNDDGMEEPEKFVLTCKTCNSTNIQIVIADNRRMGSEQTGAWGEATVSLRCRECGGTEDIAEVNA